MAGRFYEPLGRLVEFYALLPELERAVHPRDERGEDHRCDKERGDDEAIGPLYLVRDEGVDEHDRDHAERKRPRPRSRAQGGQRDGEGR